MVFINDAATPAFLSKTPMQAALPAGTAIPAPNNNSAKPTATQTCSTNPAKNKMTKNARHESNHAAYFH